MADRLADHFVALVPGLEAGLVVPLFGAGVNYAQRSDDGRWQPGSDFLPYGSELFEYLADRFEYPSPTDYDLARLTQYIDLRAGRSVLYAELRRVFDRDYEPTAVHRFFARLPAVLREARDPDYHQVVLTTNYDDVMERAFRAASEPFDVVWYAADGPEKGKFVHRLHSGDVRLIEDRNTYRGIEIDRRSLVVKVHGTVDRFGPQRDSYVITIDDYLDYLVRADVAAFLPPEIVNKLYSSHFLFLGYGLKDWNLQVILRRIWGGQRLATRASWAVWNPDPIEKLLWERRGVEVIDARLEEYIAGLEERFLKAVA